MITVLQVIFVLGILVLFILLVLRPWRGTKEMVPLPEHCKQLMFDHVLFYRQLDADGRRLFEQKVEKFLSDVRITGINTEVEDLDKVLIGASAIIPIYSFPDWEYINLHEVLLYPDAFNHEFEQVGHHRYIAGIVGNGPLQNVMILSKLALRQGFMNNTNSTNTGIHEFIHLIDKTDGSIDGIPEVLLKRQYVLPWLNMMRENMQAMLEGRSDIDLYGVVSQAEFFAVVAEYFFTRPHQLQEKHPELYAMLEKMFSKSGNEN